MPDLPPSPVARIRRRRARHWKFALRALTHLVNLVVMLAVLAFITLAYHAVTLYGAREGYAPHSARLLIAVFLAGGLVGALSWLTRRR